VVLLGITRRRHYVVSAYILTIILRSLLAAPAAAVSRQQHQQRGRLLVMARELTYHSSALCLGEVRRIAESSLCSQPAISCSFTKSKYGLLQCTFTSALSCHAPYTVTLYN